MNTLIVHAARKVLQCIAIAVALLAALVVVTTLVQQAAGWPAALLALSAVCILASLIVLYALQQIARREQRAAKAAAGSGAGSGSGSGAGSRSTSDTDKSSTQHRSKLFPPGFQPPWLSDRLALVIAFVVGAALTFGPFRLLNFLSRSYAAWTTIATLGRAVSRGIANAGLGSTEVSRRP